jgi:copper chaperone CopZ
VTQALEKVPDVESAKTEYKKKRSLVHAKKEGCSIAGEERLIQAIQDIGYRATVRSNQEKK